MVPPHPPVLRKSAEQDAEDAREVTHGVSLEESIERGRGIQEKMTNEDTQDGGDQAKVQED
jgi:hypothetical protein